MDTPSIGEMDFGGEIFEAGFIGRRYIAGIRCDCFQPSFDDCTIVRCEPLDGSEPFFINAEDF